MNASWAFCGIIAVSMTTGLGCGLAPAEPGLLPVHGTVRMDDRPASGGSVCFHPDDQASGVLPVGSIEADGTYEVYVHGKPGAPEGTYRVTVFMHEKSSGKAGHAGLPKSMIDRRYNARQTTPLSIDVRRDAGPGHYDLKIVTKSRS
ncbi:hypothetical protein Pan97_32370 [Bremerella volcania]|uniref:Uncharacterized protein n=1 Tax=Bremerella volcania TaxID=2527984 RepID=A0A518CAE3_9BACT|nr:hypothetical protein [Bremerella volcania]QDU76192.1 hypothetical protein Pan97_32370 [Bremerella volcania]